MPRPVRCSMHNVCIAALQPCSIARAPLATHAAWPRARRRLAMPHVKSGYLMVTWANSHYLDFAISWVANLKAQGITGYMVGAMDDDMLRCGGGVAPCVRMLVGAVVAVALARLLMPCCTGGPVLPHPPRASTPPACPSH